MGGLRPIQESRESEPNFAFVCARMALPDAGDCEFANRSRKRHGLAQSLMGLLSAQELIVAFSDPMGRIAD